MYAIEVLSDQNIMNKCMLILTYLFIIFITYQIQRMVYPNRLISPFSHPLRFYFQHVDYRQELISLLRINCT